VADLEYLGPASATEPKANGDRQDLRARPGREHVKTPARGSRKHSALEGLSPQERRVLELLVDGKTNKQIAQRMGLSDKTVKSYLSNIYQKLHVTRRLQAAVIYTRLSG
jgi:RNA polymerase sigma factor (sigma-70 family)